MNVSELLKLIFDKPFKNLEIKGNRSKSMKLLDIMGILEKTKEIRILKERII